jgi:hypothetical protein
MSVGGPGGGYEVELDALEKAAAAYKAQGSAVGRYLEQFTARATLPAKAFGNLPQSAQLAEQYARFFGQVVSDMGTLRESLSGGGGRLGAAAANYRSAESANILR